MMEEDKALSTRYAFLLQPIRDLQKNWDIDISHLLEEFVEKIRELSDSTESDDETNVGQRVKFNFAEAAILIQGSTMVYGKKVEYVHGLARDFYEQLKDRKNTRKVAGDRQDVNLNDGDTDLSAEEPDDPCELIDFTHLPRTVDWKTLMLKNETKPPSLLPQIPVSLMPLGDFEKTNVPLYSSRNMKEVIGKKDDFIINTGFIHSSGALLLDLANTKLLDDFAVQEAISDNSVYADESRLQFEGPPVSDIIVPADVIHNERIHTCTGEVERVRRGTSGTNLNTMTRRDTSHVNLVSGAAGTLEVGKVGEGQPALDESDGGMGDAGFDEYVDDNGVEHHPADEEFFDETDVDEPVMDLFRTQRCKHAPYQACKPSFVPEQVEERRMKKRRQLGLKASPSLSEFLRQHVYHHSVPKRTTVPVADDDFAIIFGKLLRNVERHRMRVLKERALQCSQNGQQHLEHGIQSDEEMESEDYDNFNNSSFDDEAGDPPNVPDEANLTFANMSNEDLGGRVHVSSLYMNFDDPDLLLKPSDQMTYQDLLKIHLQKYWSSAEETTSKLCKRVQLWEEKIQPLLEEEETRREFDIHQYGTELLEQYESIGETKSFVELVQSVDARYDVSRYCLALLMLANMGNVELCSGNGPENTTDGNDIVLKLLKKERHHQQFAKSRPLTC